jgi:hypothetical protein
MWQLARLATKASSGSTPAGSENRGTTCGDDDALTVRPPSKLHSWPLLYRLSVKTSPFRRQLTVAL